MWKELLLLASLQCIGSVAELDANGTLLAVPFLFPWLNNCRQHYPPGDTNQYRFFYTSQITNSPTYAELYTVNIPQTNNAQCKIHSQVKKILTFGNSGSYFGETTFITTDEQNEFCKDRDSMCYQCENNVKNLIGEFRSNPSLSLIAQLFGDYFNHFLAIYPVSGTEGEESVYTYKVLFGSPRDGTMDGLVIEVIYSHTNITVYNASGAIALRDGTELYQLSSPFELTNQCKSTVLWMEPRAASDCSHTSLEHAVIVSSKPVKVFTNQVRCNNKSRHFNYHSQLVHEIPLPSKYGQRFIVDALQAQILPEAVRNNLEYDLSILSSQENTDIKVTYYNQSVAIVTEQYYSTMDALRVRKTYNFLQTITHLDISATDPILVLLTIHSRSPEAIYYSLVVQPVRWFSNIQTVAVASVNESSRSECSYHISVFVPTNHSNPQDIMISEAHNFTNSTPLSSYSGLRGFTNGGDFKLFYFTRNNYTDTHLLVWHNDPYVDIGATVFAYCTHKHYAYSNGYISDNSPRDLSRIPPDHTPSPVDSRVIVAVLAVLLVTTIATLSVICYCRRRKNKGTYRVRNDDYVPVLVSEEPGRDYDYDVFILFSEEDEDFVRSFVYEPLRRRNYKILWRDDQSHDLFHAGGDVVADLATAIQMSRKIIVVCTRYLSLRGAFDRDVTFFKDVQKSERKRRLIPFVIEGEYASQQFKDYNQIRVGHRGDLNDRDTADELLQRLVNSIGEPIDTSVESLIFL
ncbi:uncharacterized protein LOC135349579 [Halichondria panicea]|uniref:uncharacterized protein LOC135349579 n=1 Tax=Halichondria panicea TaxID=6063 RepID=UPI00312B9B6F